MEIALWPIEKVTPYARNARKIPPQAVDKLTPQTAPLYQAASRHYRKLKTVLTRLERLSLTTLRLQAKLAQSARRNP